MNSNSRSRRLVGVLAAATLAAVALVGTAAAASGAPISRVPKIQYSAAQLHALQAQVDSWLAKSTGGTQIGINQISFEGGSTILTLPLPGEKQARAVDEAVVPAAAPNCPSFSACLYDGTFYTGARLAHSACETLTLSAFNFANIASSIHNNQSNNTATTIYNSSRQILEENQALSKVDDVGVGSLNSVFWRVC